MADVTFVKSSTIPLPKAGVQVGTSPTRDLCASRQRLCMRHLSAEKRFSLSDLGANDFVSAHAHGYNETGTLLLVG
eukprot:1144104-Amphidinium_carterae.2